VTCSCDYDPPIFYGAVVRTARKRYRCEECVGVIEPGEKYEYVSGLWERGDRISQFRTCQRCRDVRVWVQNNVPCFCWVHGNMIDDAAEAIDEAWWRAPTETVGLRFGFLRRRVMLDRHNAARQKRGEQDHAH